METPRIDLGEFESLDDAQRWLRGRVLSPVDAAAARQPAVYGNVENPGALWLGAAKPGRLRTAQWLFQGRLESHEGAHFLAGQMARPPSTTARILTLLVLGFIGVVVGIHGWITVGHLSGAHLAFLLISTVAMASAFLLNYLGVAAARAEFAQLQELLEHTGGEPG